MGSVKDDDYEAQLSAAFSSTPLMFSTPTPQTEPAPQIPQTPKTPQTPVKEPPPCVQNAMNREKKPFTYTPGGLDLSQIRSEKMARRLMRNAMSPGVQERPQPPPVTPDTPNTPKASPQFYNMPVAVFPRIQIPPNPMKLLRRTSGPFSRESADRTQDTPTAPATQESVNGITDEANKVVSDIDKALEEMITESKQKTASEAQVKSNHIEINRKLEIQQEMNSIPHPKENGLTSEIESEKLNVITNGHSNLNGHEEIETKEEIKKEIKQESPTKECEDGITETVEVIIRKPTPTIKVIVDETNDETSTIKESEDMNKVVTEEKSISNGDEVVVEATIKIVCDRALENKNISNDVDKSPIEIENKIVDEEISAMNNENTETNLNEVKIEDTVEDDEKEQSVEVTLSLPKVLSPRVCESVTQRESSVDRLTLPRSFTPKPLDSNRNSVERTVNSSRSSISPTRSIVSPNVQVQEQNTSNVTLALPRAFSPCRVESPVVVTETIPITVAELESNKPESNIREVSVKPEENLVRIIRALSPQPYDREKSVERAFSPVKFSSPSAEKQEVYSPVVMRDKSMCSPNRKLDALKTLSSDLESMPSLNICTKRFSFLRDSPDKDSFDAYSQPPPKISLVDKSEIKEQQQISQSQILKQLNDTDQLLKEAIEINKKSSQINNTSSSVQILPPWEYEGSTEPLGIESKIFQPAPSEPPAPNKLPLSTPATKWKHSYQPQIKPLGFLPGTGQVRVEEKPKPTISKETPKPVNADEVDNKEPPWRRELREIAIKRQEINDEIEAKAQVEHPWRKELRELHQTKAAPKLLEGPIPFNTDDVQISFAPRPSSENVESRFNEANANNLPIYSYPPSTNSTNSTPGPFIPRSVNATPSYSYTPLPNNQSNYIPQAPNSLSRQSWNPTPTQPFTNPAYDMPKNAGWSQTLRPKSWMERKADLCKERDVFVPEWTKSATLKRNAFSKNTSDYSSGGSSPGKEIVNAPEITIENTGQPSNNKTNSNNGYSYPWTSSPDSSLAFSPEPMSDRTPTPQSRSSPYRHYAPYTSYYSHTPVVRREYGTLSYEPGKRHQVRSCPIQSRSFKYLQLLTGTDDSFEDNEPFILQPPQHAHPRPENL